tara:strand:- start:214 stop:477 length:264 start_codon:yes stop_codon:yes gene_type:complete
MNALISVATTVLLIGFSATSAQSRCLAWTAINEVEENMAKGMSIYYALAEAQDKGLIDGKGDCLTKMRQIAEKSRTLYPNAYGAIWY